MAKLTCGRQWHSEQRPDYSMPKRYTKPYAQLHILHIHTYVQEHKEYLCENFQQNMGIISNNNLKGYPKTILIPTQGRAR